MVINSTQQTISEYSPLYDLIIPEGNLLRQINNLIDFEFVYDELKLKYCHNNGRMAQNPIRMFKYLLLKVIYDISDVDVVERSLYDMSFKYFLGLNPEATNVINPSSLTKFRKLRLQDMDLLSLLIGKTVSVAIEKGIVKSKTIIVDATHSLSRSNPIHPVDMLKLRSRQLRKAIYGVDENLKSVLPKKNEDKNFDNELAYTEELINSVEADQALVNYPNIKERFNMLKESLEDIKERYTTSKKEGDARVGHKSSDSSFFGFKTHIAMTPERLITGATVTSGDKGDGAELPELINQSCENGIEVDTVVGDTAYSGDKNLKEAKERDIKLVAKLNPIVSQGSRKEEDKFEFNKDAEMYVCPAGHLATKRYLSGRLNSQSNPVTTYLFDINKCKICLLREGCYKEGAKSKSYSISRKTPEQTEQMAFEQSDEFKEIAKERYKIEAKNAELKLSHGYGRAQSYGLVCMKMQSALTIFAVNLKRIVKLM